MSNKRELDVLLLVDEYRHQNASLQHLLDEYESRDELESRVIEFHARHHPGHMITKDAVKEIVAEYEKDKFTYKGFKGGWFSRCMASTYAVLFKVKRKSPYDFDTFEILCISALTGTAAASIYIIYMATTLLLS